MENSLLFVFIPEIVVSSGPRLIDWIQHIMSIFTQRIENPVTESLPVSHGYCKLLDGFDR